MYLLNTKYKDKNKIIKCNSQICRKDIKYTQKICLS